MSCQMLYGQHMKILSLDTAAARIPVPVPSEVALAMGYRSPDPVEMPEPLRELCDRLGYFVIQDTPKNHSRGRDAAAERAECSAAPGPRGGVSPHKGNDEDTSVVWISSDSDSSSESSSPSPHETPAPPSPTVQPRRSRWYVVTLGRNPGVFSDSLHLNPNMTGISGATAQSYKTKAEATKAYNDALRDGRVVRVTEEVLTH
ncbi:hypothetical protein FPV67DRAFT_1667912 [Lyophyllum atratum]|nr:hypothetical protein FPV67DRAFT_1667912 [Lyophyllum atratum]